MVLCCSKIRRLIGEKEEKKEGETRESKKKLEFDILLINSLDNDDHRFVPAIWVDSSMPSSKFFKPSCMLKVSIMIQEGILVASHLSLSDQ